MSPRKPSNDNSLRKRAEKLLSKTEEASKLLPDDVKKLVHELKLHQIELEMQNEQLRKMEAELQKSEERFRDLSANLLNFQERERKRIALEIHDSMGSALATCKMEMESVLREMGDDNHKAKSVLERIIPIIQETMEESRRIQMSLRPPILDDLGIITTIDWFCRQYESAHPNVSIKKEIDIEEQEVPQPLKTAIYRVIQQAFDNIAKHSKASVALLYLRKAKKSLQLIIQDNGQGFDLDEAYSQKGANRGLGLDRMREKTHLAGGFFEIESSKGTGTVITATWPIEPKQNLI